MTVFGLVCLYVFLTWRPDAIPVENASAPSILLVPHGDARSATSSRMGRGMVRAQNRPCEKSAHLCPGILTHSVTSSLVRPIPSDHAHHAHLPLQSPQPARPSGSFQVPQAPPTLLARPHLARTTTQNGANTRLVRLRHTMARREAAAAIKSPQDTAPFPSQEPPSPASPPCTLRTRRPQRQAVSSSLPGYRVRHPCPSRSPRTSPRPRMVLRR